MVARLALACAVALAFPAGLLALPVAPASATDSLAGTVTDSVGRPVSGARVAVTELSRAALTDARGHFSLGQVPRGRYTLLVSRIGFGAVSRVVQAGAGTPLTISLRAEVLQLPAVTISSTRTPRRPDQSPLPTSELRDEELRGRTNVSIARAVERLPGVRSLNTGDQIAKPVIRGLSGARVLVLDNGMRLEDYSWSDEDGPSVESRLADRIEVIRGPASLLYGSDAIGGVVNAVPAALPTAAGGGAFRRIGSEVFAGSNNMELGGGLRAEGATGRWGWRVYGVGRFAEDLHTPAGKLDNTGFVAANGDATVAWHGDRGTSSLRYTRYGGEYKLLEASPPPGGVEEEEGGPERVLGDDRLQYAGNYVIGGSRLEARAQVQRHNLIEKSDDLVASGGPRDAEVFNLLLNSLTTDVLLHHSFGERLQASAGATALYQASDSRGPLSIIPDATTSSAGGFGVAQVDLPRLTLLGGVRAEGRHLDVSANGQLDRPGATRNSAAVSADAGFVVRPGAGWSLSGNVGQAWRAPTLFELYANGPRLGEARFEVGDPTLDPERSVNLDGGVHWTGHGVRLEASAFHNAIHDFIYIEPTGGTAGGLRVYRYAHADASLDGAEVSAEVHPMDSFTFRARHDFVKGTRRDDHSPLPLMPAPRTDLEAELHADRLGRLRDPNLGVEVEFNARQDRRSAFDVATRPFTLVNLEAGVNGHLASREVHVGVSVHNALDVPYRSYLSRYKEFALDAGRNVVVRLSTGL